MNKLVVLMFAVATAGIANAGGDLSDAAQKERKASKAAESACRQAVLKLSTQSAPDKKGAAKLANKTLDAMESFCGGKPLFHGCKIVASGERCALYQIDPDNDRRATGKVKYFPKDFR